MCMPRPWVMEEPPLQIRNRRRFLRSFQWHLPALPTPLTRLLLGSQASRKERRSKVMLAETQNSTTSTTYKRASTLHITWLIARRQIGEAVRDRSTLIMSGFFLAFQTVLVLLSVGPALGDHTQKGLSNAGVLMAFFLLFVGLMPATPAVGIASGAFAGDKERGSLTP